jgi:hypothetical protein
MKTSECTCNGTGRLLIHESDAISSTICPCRMNLQPREGKVAWWTTESMKSMDWKSPTGSSASAVIERERPISEENYKLIRTEENVYFPAMANVQLDCASYGMVSEDLRELAKWLNEVADEVDRIDAEIS